MFTADIDIDVQSKFNPTKTFPCVKASTVLEDELRPHPCGVYFQNMARDPITKLAAIPFKEAEDLGFLKIDFLHLTAYDSFQSREEITELLKIEPDWSLLEKEDVVKRLFQLSKHYDLVKRIKPKSVEELADTLAIIRPSKRYLERLYIKDPASVRAELYRQEDDGYGFKKAHAVAYALTIVLQLHLVKCGLL